MLRNNKMLSSKKGDLWISAALYAVISVVVITVILSAGLPMIDNMKDRSAFEDSKDSLLTLDKHITEIANEGPGSQRVIPVEIKKGTLSLEDNGITWNMKTKADIIDPRTKLKTGNMVISSNIDVKAYEEKVGPDEFCVLENSKVKVKLKKFPLNGTCEIGDLSGCTAVDTSEIIHEFMDKSTGDTLSGNFTFRVAQVEDSRYGEGYVVCDDEGNSLDDAKVTLYMYNTSGTPSFDYSLKFIMDSEGDFIKTKLDLIS